MVDVTVAFDTLKAATRLRQAGFDEDKARALVSTFAEGLVENLATRQDLAPLATKEELAVLRSEMDPKSDSASLRAEMTATEQPATLRSEMATDFEMLRTELVRFQDRMTVRMGIAIGTAVAILVAVDKLL